MREAGTTSGDGPNSGRDAVRVRELYKSPTIAESYDAGRFLTFSGRTFNCLEKTAFERALRRAVSGLDACTVLDAPCGTGRVTEWLLRRGLRVTGLDVSQAMLSVAARRCSAINGQLRLICADLEQIPSPDESYDVVTCIRLFHHLPTEDRARILKELSRVSRRCVIANVALSTPYYRLRRRGKRLLRQGVSRQSSTYAAIAAEARQAGLRVAGTYFVARYLSEDAVIVFGKVAAI